MEEAVRTDSDRGRAALVLAVIALGALMAIGAYASTILFVGSALGSLALTLWVSLRSGVSWGWVIVVAVALRLIAFPLPPTLSDDGYRYVWDGQLTVAGVNPYSVTPSDPFLEDRQDGDLYLSLNSPEFHTVYPPLSQIIFAFAAALGGSSFLLSWYIIKLLFVGIELIGIVLLLRIVSPAVAILFAWNPLVVMETAGQGHAEGAMAALLVMAVAALGSKRRVLAGAALAGAGLLKLWPFVLAPFVRNAGMRFWFGLIGVASLLTVPFLAPGVVGNVLSSLDLYVEYFEWYAGPYFAIKGVLEPTVGYGAADGVGRALRIVFLVGLIPICWAARRWRWSTAVAWYAVAAWFIVTVTTVHPWYLVGVFALLTLAARDSDVWRRQTLAWFALTGGAVATYLFYDFGNAPYWAAVWSGWLIWSVLMSAAGVTWLLPRVMQQRGRAKWAWVREHLPDVQTLIDIGAGEGFVATAARDDGIHATCTDIIDMQRVDLPRLEIADGRIPAQDDAFDAGIIVFVLHHADDPVALLREARRVVRSGVVVVESIADTSWDRWWLPRADRAANRLRSRWRMAEQEQHLHFRDVPEWRSLFEEAGLRVTAEDSRGSFLHRQHLFVLAKD